MQGFVSILEKRGIIVDRPEIHPGMHDRRTVSTMSVIFFAIGNEIMEATTSRRSRWYEYLNLRPIFARYFKEDPEFLWTAAPKLRLTDASDEKN